MIIEEVCVENFGVYHGRHKLRLEPNSKKRPVIIIGALNGSGKTTLLDAMQLALYGKLGTYSSRGEGGYDEFLRRTINHKAHERDGASVELTFRQARSGVENQYRAKRCWAVGDGKVRETFEVFRDGTVDEFLSKHWYEYVEELLPARIAPLFFFDGEKVVELADAQQAPALLRVAIQSLLGLDIVQQLRVDLGVLSRRKRAEVASAEERASLEASQRDLDELEVQRDTAFQQCAACNGEVEKAEAKLMEARQNFRDNGGILFEQRAAIEERRKQLERDKEELETRLRDLAGGELPLLLVAGEIGKIAEADRSERGAVDGSAMVTILEERDRWIVDLAKQLNATASLADGIRKALSADRRKRKSAGARSNVFALSDEGRRILDAISFGLLGQRKGEAFSLLKKAEQLAVKIADLDRQLSAVPDEDSIQSLLQAVSAAEERVAAAGVALQAIKGRLAEIDSRLEILRRSLVRALETEVERHHAGSDAARVLTFATKASGNLVRFEEAVVRHHLERLEAFVLSSLQTLLRKERLVTRVSIDPNSFVLTLTGADGRVFSMDRLSAGERQLLAVSLLWGLAQASGRPMPTIIDTPLGRLDSEHRGHLVDRYFPKASHQVILLSTDMEIDAANYRKLKPAVSHAYTLTFDPIQGGTSVADGLAFAQGVAA